MAERCRQAAARSPAWPAVLPRNCLPADNVEQALLRADTRELLGALPHLAPLALQAAGALLLPLPAELGGRALLVGVGLVRHRGLALLCARRQCNVRICWILLDPDCKFG